MLLYQNWETVERCIRAVSGVPSSVDADVQQTDYLSSTPMAPLVGNILCSRRSTMLDCERWWIDLCQDGAQ